MSRSSLSLARHVPLYVFLGAIFWLVAALLIRFAGPELFHLGNPWLYALFAACLPAGWLFIILCLAIGGLPRSDALIPVSIMCVTGLTLDGIAISSFTSLYGKSPEHVMLGAAWLLWSVGVLLVLALYVQLVREP